MHKQLSYPSTLFKDLIEQIVDKIEDEFDEYLLFKTWDIYLSVLKKLC